MRPLKVLWKVLGVLAFVAAFFELLLAAWFVRPEMPHLWQGIYYLPSCGSTFQLLLSVAGVVPQPGYAFAIAYLIYAAISVVVGIGLLRVQLWAVVVTFGFAVLTLVWYGVTFASLHGAFPKSFALPDFWLGGFYAILIVILFFADQPWKKRAALAAGVR